MHSFIRAFVLTGLALLQCTGAGVARAFESSSQPAPATPMVESTPAASDRARNADVLTRHSIVVDGERLAYRATAGTIPIQDESGKSLAHLFFVAYTKEGAPTDAQRPITFAFNGGPGASSMWLHLGLGPKSVALSGGGTRPPTSTAMTDNPATWLTFTDLVFVDPVSSGFSRAAEGVDAQQFYEVVRDIDVTGTFIRHFLTRYERWLSPKFIAGESYGTTRAAGLVARLQDRGIDVNGLMLISSVLDFQTIAYEAPYDLPYALALPSYAATALYHKKIEGSRDELLRETEKWAIEAYLPALAKGESVSQAERAATLERLARLTGLDKNEFSQRRLRVGPLGFGKLVLGRNAPIVGRFDSRVTAAVVATADRKRETDPSFFLVTGPWYEALNHYLKHDLQVRSDARYDYLSNEANHNWKWRPTGAQGFLYVADDLADALTRDTRLRVFVAAGLYDLAAPYFAQKYSLDHMPLEAPLRAHVTFQVYPSGHQIYTDPDSGMQLKRDVAQFVGCTLAQTCNAN